MKSAACKNTPKCGKLSGDKSIGKVCAVANNLAADKKATKIAGKSIVKTDDKL